MLMQQLKNILSIMILILNLWENRDFELRVNKNKKNRRTLSTKIVLFKV